MIGARKMVGSIIVLVCCFVTVGTERFVSIGGPVLRRGDWESLNGEYLGKEGVVFQTKKNDCGPAAAAMLLQSLGIRRPLEELEGELELTEKGTTMFALRHVLRRNGVLSEGWRIDSEELRHRPFPMILFVRSDHFVVADSVDQKEDRSVFLRDPSSGRWRIPVAALPKIWNGETLIVSQH